MNPIVFVPGLFGSLGDDVIKGTGSFSFGLAIHVYRPFLDILNSLGYIEGENLFISFYDWKESSDYSSRKYLIPTIKKAKKVSGKEKVDLICHSMGGLISRSYIQGKEYYNDVDRLILIGTPNAGAVNAYYFWSGGQIPYPRIEENIFYRTLKIGFTWYFRLFKNLNYLNILRRTFPSAKDLLPSFDYGDYIIVGDENGKKSFLPINEMNVQNNFLNNLNEQNLKEVETYLIVGNNIRTNKYLFVKDKIRLKGRWKDGKPSIAYTTNLGDGTVTLNSSKTFQGELIQLTGNHSNIMYKSKKDISNILGRKTVEIKKEKEVDSIYNLMITNCEEIKINTFEKNIITSDKIEILDNKVSAAKLGNNIYWTIIEKPIGKGIEISVEPIKNKISHVFVYSLKENQNIKIISNRLLKRKEEIYI